ncbi:MAG: hypothetical protein Q8R69_13410 [Telluria sp.]|nr:hypothetical protein [Telluria sp.]
MKIAVVGAPGTGKSSLVHALRSALLANADTAECSVTEDWVPEQHRANDLTLLMGLDLSPSSGSASTLQLDAGLRHTLDKQAIAYAVVYGTGQARYECALQAIAYHRVQLQTRRKRPTSDWRWCCDTCSDAACEHRLFTALVNNKTPGSVRP